MLTLGGGKISGKSGPDIKDKSCANPAGNGIFSSNLIAFLGLDSFFRVARSSRVVRRMMGWLKREKFPGKEKGGRTAISGFHHAVDALLAGLD